MSSLITFKKTNGGRKEAGYKGNAGDCVIRSIAIATGKPYKEVYDQLHIRQKSFCQKIGMKQRSIRRGVYPQVWQPYAESLGFKYLDGSKKFTWDTLPKNKTLIIVVDRHLSCVINGVIHDSWDPSSKEIYGVMESPNKAKVEIEPTTPESKEKTLFYFKYAAEKFNLRFNSQNKRERYHIKKQNGEKIALLMYSNKTNSWKLSLYEKGEIIKSIIQATDFYAKLYNHCLAHYLEEQIN